MNCGFLQAGPGKSFSASSNDEGIIAIQRVKGEVLLEMAARQRRIKGLAIRRMQDLSSGCVKRLSEAEFLSTSKP